jgi:hypothetical protein
MNNKFFKPGSLFHQFRWMLVFLVAIIALMIYADQTGWRLFSPKSSQQWNATGPGYHK